MDNNITADTNNSNNITITSSVHDFHAGSMYATFSHPFHVVEDAMAVAFRRMTGKRSKQSRTNRRHLFEVTVLNNYGRDIFIEVIEYKPKSTPWLNVQMNGITTGAGTDKIGSEIVGRVLKKNGERSYQIQGLDRIDIRVYATETSTTILANYIYRQGAEWDIRSSSFTWKEDPLTVTNSGNSYPNFSHLETILRRVSLKLSTLEALGSIVVIAIIITIAIVCRIF